MKHLKAKIIISTVYSSIVIMVLGIIAILLGLYFRSYEIWQSIGGAGVLSFIVGIFVLAFTNQSMYDPEVIYYYYVKNEDHQ